MPKHFFGNRPVSAEEKAVLVNEVFNSVAPRYDLMNDLMSFGVHRWWKKKLIQRAKIQAKADLLDLATGTGDLALYLAPFLDKINRLILSDINSAMLEEARKKLIDRGLFKNIEYVQANASTLPFSDNSFDRVLMAFGLRNVTDQEAALRSIFRVLKPGGKVLILEFSRPRYVALNSLYDLYSFYVIPKLGKCIAEDEDSYRYLVESIRKHPDQVTLLSRLKEAGFESCTYENLAGGIVAIHEGFKF